ncbi:MAG: Smr/MutS family protein [Saprospiraceae bacterium]|nr:Smr/MutS family protein [Saprospiraceae bacterium]
MLKNNFSTGSRVRLRFTGESGVVTSRLSDDMLNIRLDNDPDFEIPAFEEDLISENELQAAAPTWAQNKKEQKPAPPPPRVLKSQYHILKPKGLQLAFEPMPGRDEAISRYKVWLINDTQFEFLMEFDLYTVNRDVLIIDNKIAAASALELGDFLSDDLNDAPEAFIKVQRITTEGLDQPLENTLKIRAKQFFNSLNTAPIINVMAHQLVLLDAFEPKQKESNSDDLKLYTQQNRKKGRNIDGDRSRHYKAFDPEAFAGFEPEIDLHIQNLMNGYARIDKGEILRIQMMHFQRFLDQAIRLGAPKVFIIHGVGEGKLKEAVSQSLKENPHVVKFKNEYHHKYGYGATEVTLG